MTAPHHPEPVAEGQRQDELILALADEHASIGLSKGMYAFSASDLLGFVRALATKTEGAGQAPLIVGWFADQTAPVSLGQAPAAVGGEPTPEMVKAGLLELLSKPERRDLAWEDRLALVYRAMLAAAPSVPSPETLK